MVSLISGQGYFTFLYGHIRVFERNSLKATRNADSSSHVGQPGLWAYRPISCSLVMTSLFCPLLLSASLSVLLWDLPFLVFFRPRGRSHAQTQNRQRDPLTDTHPHPHNESPTLCHSWLGIDLFVQWGISCYFEQPAELAFNKLNKK